MQEFILFIQVFLGTPEAALYYSGGAGGLVRWLSLKGVSWRDGISSIIVGAMVARFGSPLALPAVDSLLSGFSQDATATHGLAGFLVGIGGITVVGGIADWWKDWRARKHSQEAGPASPPPKEP